MSQRNGRFSDFFWSLFWSRPLLATKKTAGLEALPCKLHTSGLLCFCSGLYQSLVLLWLSKSTICCSRWKHSLDVSCLLQIAVECWAQLQLRGGTYIELFFQHISQCWSDWDLFGFHAVLEQVLLLWCTLNYTATWSDTKLVQSSTSTWMQVYQLNSLSSSHHRVSPFETSAV